MRRLLEPQAAREAAPTGSSSLACWPKRIDATFGNIERDGLRGTPLLEER